jgi:hypothetical protein
MHGFVDGTVENSGTKLEGQGRAAAAWPSVSRQTALFQAVTGRKRPQPPSLKGGGE